MKIIVLNCGSSTIKYQLIDMPESKVHARGVVEKIGLHGSFIKNEREDGDRVILEGDIIDHQMGIEYILGILSSEKHGSITSFDDIDAIGHRVVHGGETFHSSVLINEDVISKMKECIDLAPLHNPPNLKGIYAMQELLPEVPQIGVFDTAFHQTMPQRSFMYAIPYSLYKKYSIRRYGFHGTSHYFVSQRACAMIKEDCASKKIITCHLGNGASMAALDGGRSVDTTMGLTPVEGLIMGTRSGDLDLGVLTYIMRKEEIGITTANTLINKFSGMLGVSGVSSDMREIEEASEAGEERARLAMEMYVYRIKKYIGAYTAAMNGLDLLVFTGGVGENSAIVRKEVCTGMDYFGIQIDGKKNRVRGKEADISHAGSRVKILVVPTNEELVIARDTMRIVQNGINNPKL